MFLHLVCVASVNQVRISGSAAQLAESGNCRNLGTVLLATIAASHVSKLVWHKYSAVGEVEKASIIDLQDGSVLAAHHSDHGQVNSTYRGRFGFDLGGPNLAEEVLSAIFGCQVHPSCCLCLQMHNTSSFVCAL